MPSNVRSLFENPTVREEIRELANGFRKHGVEFVKLLKEEHQLDLDHLQDAEIIESCRAAIVASAGRFWRERLAPRIGNPSILTSRDFKQAFVDFLLNDTTDPDSQYESFANYLANVANVQRSFGPFRLITGLYFADPEYPITLWTNESGFSVVLNGSLPIRFEHYEPPKGFPWGVISPRAVYIRVEGCCSSDALRQFRAEVCRVLRCVLRSLSLLKTFHHSRSRMILWQEQDIVHLGYPRTNPPSDWLVALLNAYFSSPTKKDSIDRRVRNALHLLVQSDQQKHTAVGIALSVAAIEALVCRKSGDIANMFADNTASILEPDPTFRAAAVDFAKDLYDARSRVLHGDMLEHEATTRRQARVLAAAVLKAILERRDFQRRAGVESETPDALLDELRRGKWVPGQLTGVSASPVRQLWGASIEAAESQSDDDDE
jgi:hypothetical protein